MNRWTFLTNHAHVLLCIERNPDIRLRDVAETVGITERAAQRIIAELIADGYVMRARIGRRNSYEVNHALPLRHPLEEHRNIGDLLTLLDDRSCARLEAAGDRRDSESPAVLHTVSSPEESLERPYHAVR